MPAIRRILVAVKDTSARTLPAVQKAAQIARAVNAQLELFHAISEPVYVDALAIAGQTVAQLQKKWREAHLKKLEKVAEKLRAEGTKVTTAVDWDFPAFESILRRATRSKADLIVAERHATRHLAPWVLRFNDWELLRRSRVPVLLVKSSQAYSRPVVLAAIDPGHSFAKPAKLDIAILAAGQQLAAALQGTLHAAHAFVPATVDVEKLDLNLPNLSAYIEAEAAKHAKTALDKELAGSDIPPSRRHLIGRHAVDAIPELAKELQAQVVVMGAISRTGIKRMLIGNTAERILDALPCDVLVLKPANFASRVPRGRRGVQFIATPMVT
jgi:universal stress protein E